MGGKASLTPSDRRHAFEAGVDPLFTVPDSVQTGQLRETAFEAAGRSLISEVSGAVALFDAYTYDALFSATVAIARELAVAGRSVGDIVLEPAEDAIHDRPDDPGRQGLAGIAVDLDADLPGRATGHRASHAGRDDHGDCASVIDLLACVGGIVRDRCGEERR